MKIVTYTIAAVVAIALMVSPVTTAAAAVKANSLFSDGAVLQQGMSLPVWGTANDGEKVTVKIRKQEVSTTARGGGWMVRLRPLKAGGPFTMTISGDNIVELKNIFVGEVWICSGQSNMWLALKDTANAQQVIAGSKDPMLHLFTVPQTFTDFPSRNVVGKWEDCDPDTVAEFSAVAYYFGRELRKWLKVPVGLISPTWGGTTVQAWTSRGSLTSDPVGDALFKNPPPFIKYPPKPDLGQNKLSGLYNGMIAPLVPYGIRGVIWYQGESNVGQTDIYRHLFPLMIRDWREHWGEGNFPFLFVQLPPFDKIVSEPQESDWAEIREVQLQTSLTSPNTGMAVITDFGSPDDIHPKQKEPVGYRLALAARALAYGQRVVYQGPIYKSMRVDGNRAVLNFEHDDGGLIARGGELTGFAIAGEDKKFHNAQAKIQGAEVVVWTPEVSRPVAVRYGWADCPVVNLYNGKGLPASPFRTDHWASANLR